MTTTDALQCLALEFPEHFITIHHRCGLWQSGELQPEHCHILICARPGDYLIDYQAEATLETVVRTILGRPAPDEAGIRGIIVEDVTP